MAAQPEAFAGYEDARRIEEYVIHRREIMGETFANWKTKIGERRSIEKGDWDAVFPGETPAERYDKSLKVENVITDDAADAARLVTESALSIRDVALTASTSDADKARMHEAIAAGYWIYDDADEMLPDLVMDIVGDGGCFVLCWPKQDHLYPCHSRIDPMFIYPDIVDRELVEAMVVTPMKVFAAAHKYPELNLDPKNRDDGELIETYSKTMVTRVFRVGQRKGFVRGGGTNYRGYLISKVEYDIDAVPIAYYKLPWKDGAFRGTWEHAARVLNYGNRARTLLMDNLEQAVYSPVLENNVIGTTFGPMSTYQTDNIQYPSDVRRVAPAQLPREVFAVAESSEEAARGGLAFPRTRQGDSGNLSIASAAYVDATQGQRSTLIRFLQREGIAALRKRQTLIDYAWDKTEPTLNVEKPLLAPAGTRTTYIPSKHIGERVRLQMVYGLLSGMDTDRKSVRLLQLRGGGLISTETAVANLDIMAGTDYRAEMLRIDRDKVHQFTLETGLAQAMQMGVPVWKIESLMAAGHTFEEAYLAVTQEFEAQQQQMMAMAGAGGAGAPGQPTLPPGGAAPASVGAQNLALTKGGVPGATPGIPAGIQMQPAPPPGGIPALENILVR